MVAASVTLKPLSSEVTLRLPAGEVQTVLSIPGLHSVRNALAAAACATAAGLAPAAIGAGLAAFRPATRRLQIKALAEGATLLDDSYNANPDSVRAAIDVLAGCPAPTVLVLGDMGELGPDGPAFHREVGAYARARGIVAPGRARRGDARVGSRRSATGRCTSRVSRRRQTRPAMGVDDPRQGFAVHGDGPRGRRAHGRNRGGALMLLELAQWLAREVRLFNVFSYITLRAVLSCLTALAISFMLGPLVIRKLTAYKIGQSVRDDGPQTHLIKSGTPTMGGALILLSIGITTLLWGDLSNRFLWIVLLVTVAFGTIGWIDDYRKVVRRNPKGLSAREVLLAVADRPGGGRLPSPGLAQQRAGTVPAHRAVLQERRLPARRTRLHRADLLRHRRHLERGQPDRRPGRPRDHADRDDRRRARHLRLRGRPRGVLEIPRPAVHPGRRRTGGVLRRACRRRARLPVVQRLSGRSLHGRRRRARARRRARHDRGDRAPGDRAVHHGRRVRRRDAVGDDPGRCTSKRPAASASSAWRRCTTTTSSRAGRNPRSWCASGSSP